MIGSNAALPIVGGSILNHEHFQGGGHLMPMHKAPFDKAAGEFYAPKYSNVKVGIADWYNSVVRIESESADDAGSLAKDVIAAWKIFSDESCGIIAETDGTPHNTLAPVLRKDGDKYIFDLILRNNITSEEYPDGVFHAHPEYHNIKKEGIGLIEAMGLYILPGRLKRQLNAIADILCGNAVYDEVALSQEDNDLYVHRNMIKKLYSEGVCRDKAAAEARVTAEVNDVCKKILGNTAVFKKDENGLKGFKRFLKSAGIEQAK